MSIANDNLYRYLLEEDEVIIGSIETTAPLAINDEVEFGEDTYTVNSLYDKEPTISTSTVEITPTTSKRYILLMDKNVIENHGYVEYDTVITRQEEGYGTNKRVKVAVVTAA